MNQEGLHYFIKLVNEWKGKYHTDMKGRVCFQNKRTMANIWFTHNSMHKIQPHSRGIEQLPETVESPEEIWSMWEDKTTQRIVLRNYIKGDYVVQTVDGIIVDAFTVKNQDKYRSGVLIVV